jgi:hypothetical protein
MLAERDERGIPYFKVAMSDAETATPEQLKNFDADPFKAAAEGRPMAQEPREPDVQPTIVHTEKPPVEGVVTLPESMKRQGKGGRRATRAKADASGEIDTGAADAEAGETDQADDAPTGEGVTL